MGVLWPSRPKAVHFLVQQDEVDKGDWDITRMSLSLTGKILLFKTLNIFVRRNISAISAKCPAILHSHRGVEMLKTVRPFIAGSSRERCAPVFLLGLQHLNALCECKIAGTWRNR